MSLFATAPTDSALVFLRRAVAASYRRAFGFGAVVLACLSFDLALFLATGLPTPIGALAALLTVTVTTRSVIEGRDVSVREGLQTIWARRTAILATALGGLLVGLPLLLIIGTAMAVDPRAAVIIAAEADRPLVGILNWVVTITTEPSNSAAQAILFLGVGLWSAVCVHFLFVWQLTLGDVLSGWGAMRASVPIVRRGYRRLVAVGVIWALLGSVVATVAYGGLISVAIGLYAPLMAGGDPALLFIGAGLLLIFATAPILFLTGWYLLAQLFVALRATAGAAPEANRADA